MRFSVLGSVSIADADEAVVLQPSKPLSLLAALLVHPNQGLTVDYLRAAVWDDSVSTAAKATLHTYVLRLRRLFRKFGISDDAVETVPGGYRFPATAATLDLLEFRELARTATVQADPHTELESLRAALSLWQGPPLGNVQSAILHRDEVPRLVEEWLCVAERRFDLELALGRHRDIAGDLRAATLAHPGHERFWAQLIEALYRAGRQSDALAEYRRVKAYLQDDLGVDPGSSLQQLELAILRGEEFAPTHPILPATATVSARHRLPPDLPHFTGRAEHVELLTGQITGPRSGPMVVVISGPPGIGKTALSAHVAHLVKDRFPGEHWAVRLDEDSQAGPYGEAPKAAGTLLLIDNATSVEQVRHLLPSSPASAAIVTSRSSLAGLAATRGCYLLRLGTLWPDESLQLLRGTLGADRVDADPEAARTLADLCGHFPFTLTVAASRLLLAHRRSLADYVDWLCLDPVRKLSLATDPSMSVLSRYQGYLAQLPIDTVDAYRTVATAGVDTLTVGHCGKLLNLPEAAAERLLEELVDASLLEIDSDGHYYVYPLLRTVARAVDHSSTAPDALHQSMLAR